MNFCGFSEDEFFNSYSPIHSLRSRLVPICRLVFTSLRRLGVFWGGVLDIKIAIMLMSMYLLISLDATSP
jgi:hypothetical protein